MFFSTRSMLSSFNNKSLIIPKVSSHQYFFIMFRKLLARIASPFLLRCSLLLLRCLVASIFSFLINPIFLKLQILSRCSLTLVALSLYSSPLGHKPEITTLFASVFIFIATQTIFSAISCGFWSDRRSFVPKCTIYNSAFSSIAGLV